MHIQTRKALIASALATLLCLTMLIGSTFAWFTDTASTSVNVVQAGTLDVQLLNEDDQNLEGLTLNFVKAAGAAENEPLLWEPGCTYSLPAVFVKNNGNLALKYKLMISGIVGDAKLLEAIDWTITKDGEEIDLANFQDSLANESTSGPLVLTGHMRETAGNEYQGLFIDGIGITVIATQDTVEHDSTDNTYDAGAQLPIILIAPITTNTDNTVAAPVTLGASTANAVSAADPVSVAVPVGAKLKPGTSDFTVKVEETERYSSVPLNPAAYALAFDIDMPLADDNSVVVPITVHIGSGLNLTAVYHDGTEMTEANTGDANTYVYDDTTGNITMYITHCSVFTFVHVADFAVSDFSEFTAALRDAKDGDIIALTADIDPTNNFTFNKSVTIDLKGYGFVRAKEASGGYSIKLMPGCDLTMKNGRWDMAGTFGDISAEGNTGTCNVYYENVVFTNLDNPTKEELASRPGNSSNLVKTAFKANMQGNFTVNATFKNCTFNNASVEFSGFDSGNTYTANFIGCTFNNIGNAPAIKADNYGMTEDCVVNVTDCTFNITVTSNVTAIETRYNGNTVKLNLTNNTVNGSIADSNFYKVFSTTSLKFYDETQKFEVVENNTVYQGIANLN